MHAVREWLKQARSVAVLTGAGVSAESGVPTFRGANGLWKQYRAEDLATPGAFARDPKLVWEWYDWRRGLLAEAQAQSRSLRAGRARKTRTVVHLDHAECRRTARIGRQPQCS